LSPTLSWVEFGVVSDDALIDDAPGTGRDTTVTPSASAVHKQGRAIPITGVLPELVVDATDNASKVRLRFRQSAPPTPY
jgi:hypothetical protein